MWLDAEDALKGASLFEILDTTRRVSRESNLHVCLKDITESERAGIEEKSIKYENKVMEYRTVEGGQHPNFMDMIGFDDGDDSWSDESDW